MSEWRILERIGKLVNWRSRGGLVAVVVVAESIVAFADSCQWADELDKSFEMPGEKSIMAAKDCGLVNGLLSVNGWIEDVAEVRRVHAPPYFCDDLIIKFKFNGKPVPAARNVWRPEVLTREGALDGWRIVTRLYPLAGERTILLKVTAENTGKAAATLKISHEMEENPNYLEKWQFSSPRTGLPIRRSAYAQA